MRGPRGLSLAPRELRVTGLFRGLQGVSAFIFGSLPGADFARHSISLRMAAMPLFVLFLGSFCLGTAEFMATGLLPQVAADLGVSIPRAGSIVTWYALGVAIGGPLLAVLFGNFPRKAVLIALMLVFAGAQVICAIAPSFDALLVGRVLGAACQGSFFGIASIVAITVAGEGKAGRALSLMVAGITVANILGLPGGTMIGSAFGWRMSFVALAVVAALVAVLIAVFVPSTKSEQSAKAPFGRQLRALAHPDIVLSYVVMTFASIGFFGVFTFVTPLLTTVTQIPADVVPMLLLAFGVGSTIGALVGGRLADWKPMTTVIALLVGECLVFASVLTLAHQPVVMAVAVVVLGFCAFAYAPSLFTRLFKAAGDAPDLASTLISTAFNIGIASGSTLGATVLATGGDYPQLGWLGLTGASVALLAVILMIRNGRAVTSLEGAVPAAA